MGPYQILVISWEELVRGLDLQNISISIIGRAMSRLVDVFWCFGLRFATDDGRTKIHFRF